MKMRRVVLAAATGTVIEWFDFYLFGSMAALVLGPLFFPADNAAASTMLALGTFAVAFVARPIGGIIFGHLGDRVGRKRTLVVTLFLMGSGTFLMGVLPTYEQWGIAAPIILVILRVMQGLGLGGEFAGATLLTVEHGEHTGRRGFYGSLTIAASPVGFMLSAGVIALVAHLAGEEAFQSWAWRIPFLCSSLLLLVGFYVRAKIEDAPAFRALAESDGAARMPLKVLLTEHRRPLVISILASLSIFVGFYLAVTFGTTFATGVAGISTSFVLFATMLGQVAYFVGIIGSGLTSDFVGRRAPIIAGLVGFGVWSFVFYPGIASGTSLGVIASFVPLFFFLGVLYGPMGAFLAELFGTSVRYTGVSLGYQLAGAMVGGMSPIVAVGMYERFDSTVPVSAYAGLAAIVSIAAVLCAKETSLSSLTTEPTEPRAVEVMPNQ